MIVRDFERPVSVTGYDKSDGPKTYQTVSGVIGYNHPRNGEVHLLQVHQAIYMPQLEHNLLCPMQLRLNDIEVNEMPKFLSKDPTDAHHSIGIPTQGDETLTIPLSLDGVTSCFPSFKPTLEQFDSAEEGVNLHDITYDLPDWDPHSEDYSRREANMLDSQGNVYERQQRRPLRICSLGSTCETFDGDFGIALQANRQVSQVQSTTSGSMPVDRGRWDDKHVFNIAAMSSASSPKLDPETLAQRWGIGIAAAKKTIERTTQRGFRTVAHPSLSRRFRTNDRQMRYRRLPIVLFMDTLIANMKSRRGNKYAQVYCASNGWKRAFPIGMKSQVHETLSLLFTRDGVPPIIICDDASEQIAGKFKQKARQADCHIKPIEPNTPQSDMAETAIKELKNGVARKMFNSKSPKRLWDDCLEFEALIQSNTCNDRFINEGEVPETLITGETSDISPLAQHGWYEWVMFRDTSVSFPDSKMVLGRYLGPSIDVGPAMTAKILKANGKVMHRGTYRALTPKEIASEEHQKERQAFDASVLQKLGGVFKAEDLADEDVEIPTYPLYEDNSGEAGEHCKEADVTPEEGDEFINADVLLPHNDTHVTGRVIARKRDADGELKGTRNENPILDTRTYQVEFPDGEVTEYAANVIAENMWAQCDLEGRQHLLLDSIVDHRTDGTAVKFADRFVTVGNKKHLRKTTTGWFLCVQWKDGTMSWERLADLKESYPIEVAEYTVARGIDHEPAFSWWVPFTLKKRNRIIAAVNKRYWKTTHKFGIRVPKSYNEAVQLDKENGNTLWQDAIKMELAAVKIAFEILEDDTIIAPGYQEIECHMVFDVKMENFRRKMRYVAGGNTTETPKTLTYASVVSRETVRIALTIAALNALEVKGSDVENAYLTAPVAEKIWTTLGPEFGIHAGKKALIKRALYGLRSAGFSYRSHMADCMRTLGYESCKADPDLWYKAMVRPSDGFEYYAYMLIYTDDCLSIHHDAIGALKELDKYFKMKPGSIGAPDVYLGTKLRETVLPNGVKAWGMSSSKYVQEATANVEKHLRSYSKTYERGFLHQNTARLCRRKSL